MSYVALIGAGTTLAVTAMKKDQDSSGAGVGDGFMGGGGPSTQIRNPLSAAYGNTLGNDGWVINFGSGDQNATTTKKTSDTFSGPTQSATADYPLGVGGRYVDQLAPTMAGYGAGTDPTTIGLLLVGAAIVLKAARK